MARALDREQGRARDLGRQRLRLPEREQRVLRPVHHERRHGHPAEPRADGPALVHQPVVDQARRHAPRPVDGPPGDRPQPFLVVAARSRERPPPGHQVLPHVDRVRPVGQEPPLLRGAQPPAGERVLTARGVRAARRVGTVRIRNARGGTVRGGADERHRRHPFRVVHREPLRDLAAQREAHHVRPRRPARAQHADRVGDQVVEVVPGRARRRERRTPGVPVVVTDHPAAPVRQQRAQPVIPPVHGLARPGDQQQRRGPAFAELLDAQLRPVHRDDPLARSGVRHAVRHVPPLPFGAGRRPPPPPPPPSMAREAPCGPGAKARVACRGKRVRCGGALRCVRLGAYGPLPRA